MLRLKTVALSGALLALTAILPLAAQQPDAAPGIGGPAAGPSDEATVTKAGVALRQVSQIRSNYTPRIASAKSDTEKQGLQQQAMGEAMKAINDQGLSIDQYNKVIQEAQADPGVQQRLITAAKTAK